MSGQAELPCALQRGAAAGEPGEEAEPMIRYGEFVEICDREAWVYGPLAPEQLQRAWMSLDEAASGSVTLGELRRWWEAGGAGRHLAQLPWLEGGQQRERLSWAAREFRKLDVAGAGHV
jgi:Ca2+-binding EF-hand superfamily protein